MTTKNMTGAEYLASLGDALSLRGEHSVKFVTVVGAIRAELARAIKLGVLPAGTKLSVRAPHHCSLRIEIVAWAGPVFTDAYTEHLLDPTGTPSPRERNRDHLTTELVDAINLCERIASRHNYDNSNIQSDHFDVGYYLNVDARAVEAAARHGIETERNPAFAELLRKAQVAAAALGPSCTKSVLGRGGLAAAGEWSLNRLVKLAETAEGRPVEYSPATRRWLPIAA